MNIETILNEINFNNDGLVPVIAQDDATLEVLMMAWMNKEALVETLNSKQVCYYSRSRAKLWKKGESSGQIQTLVSLTIDCDGDTLLAKVKQQGVACHTGRKTCFYKKVEGNQIRISHDVLIAPQDLYKK